MKATHINTSYDITNFEELKLFLELSIGDKLRYIVNNTDYMKEYVDSNDNDENAISFLKKGLESNNKENFEKYISPFIDVVDIPAFVMYDKDIKMLKNQEWMIYINDDALDVYKAGHFLQGIENLSTPNMLVEIDDIDEEEGTFNIAYLKQQLMGDNLSDYSSIEKLEMLKKTMGFLLFYGRGALMYNEISDKHIIMSDNNKAEDYVFVYKLNSEWHVYGNNEKGSVYNSDKLHHLFDWVKGNHAKNKHLITYNPKHDSYLGKVKTNLYKQRINYLSNINNRRNVKKAKGGENKKPVIQLDRYSGYSIQTWPSASDASKSLGISRTSITKVANGVGATAGGYGWRFA